MLGDDDPLDICDLSERIMPVGEIYRAKVLGSFCLIDQGEIDWKIFVMDES
jgi:inorganic pyrophosphatase